MHRSPSKTATYQTHPALLRPSKSSQFQMGLWKVPARNYNNSIYIHYRQLVIYKIIRKLFFRVLFFSFILSRHWRLLMFAEASGGWSQGQGEVDNNRELRRSGLLVNTHKRDHHLLREAGQAPHGHSKDQVHHTTGCPWGRKGRSIRLCLQKCDVISNRAEFASRLHIKC